MINYLPITFNGIKFWFKLDLNPLTNEYDPHIWIRHTVEPVDAIHTYFTAVKSIYNNKYNRYEAYSLTSDITIYYIFRKNIKNEIIVISAIKGKWL